jgi:hypothetical protein
VQDDDTTQGDHSESGDAIELARLRAENERLRAEVEGQTEQRQVVKSHRRRGVLSIALVLLGALLLPMAVLTVWTRNQMLNTERYLRTIAPLSDDPVLTSALSTRISNTIIEELDVKALAQEALPENAQLLAAPIASGAATLVHTATNRLVQSEQFDKLWIEANRVGHESLVAVLTGRKGAVVSTENGKVIISLGPLVTEVLQRVDEQFGIDISSRIPADKINIKYTLIDSPQLADLQTQVRWFDRLSWFTLILAFACFVGAVFAAPVRRKGVLYVGVAVLVSMLLTRLGLSFGRETYLTHLPSEIQSHAAAASVFDTLTRFLLQAFRVLFAVGAVLVVAAWVAGPSSAAVWIRSLWNRALGRGGAGIGGTVDLGPVPHWVHAHIGALRIVIAALSAIVLVTWTRPTGKVVLLIAFVALIALAIVQLLAGAESTKSSDEPPTPSDDAPQPA